MTEKNSPLDSAVPEFWKVERMPEAAPRCRAGTLPLVAVVVADLLLVSGGGRHQMPWARRSSSGAAAIS
jgi:hypothetical protein